MERIARARASEVVYVELNRPYAFESPYELEEFAALIVANDASLKDEERHLLSRQLVDSGCRYAVCTGHDSLAWDDSMDWAWLETDPRFDPPEETLVMTSWHDAEDPLEDVCYFLMKHTSFGDFEPRRFLVVFLGPDADRKREIVERIRELAS